MPSTVSLSDPRPLTHAEQDYSGAELTLLYDRMTLADKTSVRSLVFAVVELLHENLEFGPELPTGKTASCIRFGYPSHELNLRRVRLPVREAIDWYRRCAAGQGEVPLTGAERAQGKMPYPLALPSLGEEPPWPHVVLESEGAFWGNTPFWGHRPGGTRRHQLIAETVDFTVGSWSMEDREKARNWLREQFPIDIFERPRLIGSIHLVLTNPVFGRVNARLNSADPSQVHLHIQRWPGRALSGLLLHVRQERPTGPMLLDTIPIEHSLTTLQLPFAPHLLGYEIVSEAHGLLYTSKPSGFIHEIHMSLHIETKVRQVSVPERSSKRGAETYSVPVTEPRESRTGERTLSPALAALLQDDDDFRQRQHALQLGQRWFDGDVEEAAEFVRGLIRNAGEDVLIVDAYFGYTELMRYALASSIRGVKVQILTSQEYLERKQNRESATTYGELLAAALSQVHKQDDSLTIEVRVGTGSKPPVHDRFLVVGEDTVWLVGSSLNELGNRGTTVVRLPHAKPVREALLQHWAVAPTLESFMARPRPVLGWRRIIQVSASWLKNWRSKTS